MEKNIAGQKWTVFAFDLTDNTPKTGDANQITAEISIDGAAGGGNITDANPTELEDGYYVFDLEAAETNGDYLLIMPESSTPDIQVIGVPGAVWTTTPTAEEIVTALMADTGFTQGGSMSFEKLQNILAAWIAGDWRNKSGSSTIRELLDPDDGSVILEMVVSETTPFRTITVKI